MLTPYQQAVLARELADGAYTGLTADQAWAWLMLPVVTTSQQDSHVLLTPTLAAATVGPQKAEAIAQKILAALPATGPAFLQSGVDLSSPITATFLNALVDGTMVLQADVDTLKALSTHTVTTTSSRRFESRFDPVRWSHVAADGSAGVTNDPALSGFPNDLVRADFNAGWTAVGRS